MLSRWERGCSQTSDDFDLASRRPPSRPLFTPLSRTNNDRLRREVCTDMLSEFFSSSPTHSLPLRLRLSLLAEFLLNHQTSKVRLLVLLLLVLLVEGCCQQGSCRIRTRLRLDQSLSCPMLETPSSQTREERNDKGEGGRRSSLTSIRRSGLPPGSLVGVFIRILSRCKRKRAAT